MSSAPWQTLQTHHISCCVYLIGLSSRDSCSEYTHPLLFLVFTALSCVTARHKDERCSEPASVSSLRHCSQDGCPLHPAAPHPCFGCFVTVVMSACASQGGILGIFLGWPSSLVELKSNGDTVLVAGPTPPALIVNFSSCWCIKNSLRLTQRLRKKTKNICIKSVSSPSQSAAELFSSGSTRKKPLDPQTWAVLDFRAGSRYKLTFWLLRSVRELKSLNI